MPVLLGVRCGLTDDRWGACARFILFVPGYEGPVTISVTQNQVINVNGQQLAGVILIAIRPVRSGKRPNRKRDVYAYAHDWGNRRPGFPETNELLDIAESIVVLESQKLPTKTVRTGEQKSSGIFNFVRIP